MSTLSTRASIIRSDPRVFMTRVYTIVAAKLHASSVDHKLKTMVFSIFEVPGSHMEEVTSCCGMV